MDQIQRLIEIMARLRAEDGCPWDREQDHQSLKKYMVEEVYECLDAIDSGDDQALCDELGDVLLQVVFHCQIAREEGRFDLKKVAESISDKLVRRHPHVFGDSDVADAEGVLAQWEEIKAGEKASAERSSALDSVPKGLPALEKAEKLQKKASKQGFDWEPDDVSGVIAKVREELDEMEASLDQADKLADEFGDLLFSMVNLSRFLKLDAASTLSGSNRRFEARFRAMEAILEAEGKAMGDCTPAEFDTLWETAKKETG